MRIRLLRRSLVVVVALGAVLSGPACAQIPPAAPTASPTPEASGLPRPESVIPLECADVLGSATAAQILGPGTAAPGPGAPSLFSTIYRQAGYLTCQWVLGEQPGTADGAAVRVWVAPDARDEYLEAHGPVADAQYTDVDFVGDRSEPWCSTFEGLSSCWAEVLVGDYWVAVSVFRLPGMPEEEMRPVVRPAVEEVAAAVAAAGPGRPLWTPPAPTFAGTSCTPELIAVVQEATGWPELHESGTDFDPIVGLAFQRVGPAFCHLQGPISEYPAPADTQGVSVDTVPGGAWLVEELVAEPASDPAFGTFAPVSIEPGDGAVVACDVRCRAFVAFDGSLVEVTAGPISREQFLTVVTAVIVEFATGD